MLIGQCFRGVGCGAVSLLVGFLFIACMFTNYELIHRDQVHLDLYRASLRPGMTNPSQPGEMPVTSWLAIPGWILCGGGLVVGNWGRRSDLARSVNERLPTSERFSRYTLYPGRTNKILKAYRSSFAATTTDLLMVRRWSWISLGLGIVVLLTAEFLAPTT